MVSADSFVDFSHDIVCLLGAKTPQVWVGEAFFV